jgi:hypothetical protein
VAVAFEEWLLSLGSDYWSLDPDNMERLRDVFDEHGPVAHEELLRIIHDHVLPLAREAAALVARDIAATTDVEPPRFEYRDEYESGSIRVAYWGRYATTTILGLTQPEVTVEIADFMQEEVMVDVGGVWPMCVDHRVGLHPLLQSGRATWFCRAGSHVAAEIGRLGS